MSKVLNKYVISEPFASVTALKAFDTSAGDAVDAGVLANVLADNADAAVATSDLYAYSVLATTAGNDDTIVTPDNVTEPAAGRWLKITDRQIAGIIANDEHGYSGSDTGAADAYVVTVAGTLSAYGTGLRLWVIVGSGNTNTGASTINVDGIGAANIKLADGTDPGAGDILADSIMHLVYDGTNFILVNPIKSMVDGVLLTGATPSHQEGLFYYNSTEKTPAFYNDESNVTLNIGQESWVRVYNDSGAQIDNGKVVYISGAEGAGENRPEVSLAQANALATSQVLGIATHDIANAGYGWVTRFGLVNDLDTSSYTAGDVVYLDSAVAGGLTTTAPTSPNYAVFLGVVSVVNASTGQIVLFPSNEAVSAGGGGAGSATQLVLTVRKDSAGTINAGEVVYVTGYNAGNDAVLVELADSSVAGTMPAIGIAQGSFTNSSNGTAVIAGRIADSVDTSSFSVGDTLYVSETAGQVTATKPTGAALIQNIGTVVRSNASNGVIEVGGSGRSNDLPNIADTKIWIGDASGVPQEFSLSGDATMTAGGVVTVSNSATNSRAINQATHGFTTSAVTVVRWNGSAWIKAQADSAANAETQYIAIASDANNFTLYPAGSYISSFTALTANTIYFLDPSSAGGVTATEPSTSGQVSKPIFETITTTTGYVLGYRGDVIP